MMAKFAHKIFAHLKYCGKIDAAILLISSMCAAQTGAPPGINPKAWDEINYIAERQKQLTTMNTPGTELRAEEIQRVKTDVGTMVQYELFAKNLPGDRQYILGALRVNQHMQIEPEPKTIDSSGKVMDAPNDSHKLILMAARGEPYNFQLASKDGKYKAFVSIIPFPIIGEDGVCSTEAILLKPDAEAVLVQGQGFQSNIDISVTVDSEGEHHGGEVKTDPSGKFSFIVMPYKKGVAKGQARVTATSPKCHSSLTFTWGKNTYHVE